MIIVLAFNSHSSLEMLSLIAKTPGKEISQEQEWVLTDLILF